MNELFAYLNKIQALIAAMSSMLKNTATGQRLEADLVEYNRAI